MSLTRVTITGADDAVRPASLLELSEEFDFVEWGILVSETRRRTPRYPSFAWCFGFSTDFEGPVADRLARAALHLCGRDARAAFGHDFSWIDNHSHVFGRVQLNGFQSFIKDDDALASIFRLAMGRPEKRFILQAPTEEAMHAAQTIASACRPVPDDEVRNVLALWDPSGGTGAPTSTWPSAPLGLKVGYAGGIGPDNVVDMIHLINAVTSQDFWIDMESHVRTNDAFDLDKVRRVLELAKPFVRPPQRGGQ